MLIAIESAQKDITDTIRNREAIGRAGRGFQRESGPNSSFYTEEKHGD